MKYSVVKTELGWEIAYDGDLENQPVFRTRKDAVTEMHRQRNECARIDAADRRYQAQYAYACGYHD